VDVTGSRDPRSDEELLSQVRNDADALEELYRRCVGKTVAFAIRRCGTPEQVHDLVAATWIEVITASSRYDPSRGRAVP
jgi:DNA-directed RNA polymerase specialized sigma24 family protein